MASNPSYKPNVRQEITALLNNMSADKEAAMQQLLPLLYEEMRRLAHLKLRYERKQHTLNTTALVHEAYLRLVSKEESTWENRIHFMASAAKTMRHVLLNYAEKRQTLKRGGGAVKVPLDEVHDAITDEKAEEILDLEEALQRLAVFDQRGAQVVEYRYFGGLTEKEIADVMGISIRTVRRSWFMAKNWIRNALAE